MTGSGCALQHHNVHMWRTTKATQEARSCHGSQEKSVQTRWKLHCPCPCFQTWGQRKATPRSSDCKHLYSPPHHQHTHNVIPWPSAVPSRDDFRCCIVGWATAGSQKFTIRHHVGQPWKKKDSHRLICTNVHKTEDWPEKGGNNRWSNRGRSLIKQQQIMVPGSVTCYCLRNTLSLDRKTIFEKLCFMLAASLLYSLETSTNQTFHRLLRTGCSRCQSQKGLKLQSGTLLCLLHGRGCVRTLRIAVGNRELEKRSNSKGLKGSLSCCMHWKHVHVALRSFFLPNLSRASSF